jgi:hypothetical protein
MSTSAIRWLIVGSHPGNSMPAALRMTLRPQGPAVGQLDADPGVVLGEARHLTSVVDVHRQLGDPGGQDPLDLALPDPERVWVTRREVAHLQCSPAERRDLNHLTLGQEPIRDPALIEHLDRARVESAGP